MILPPLVEVYEYVTALMLIHRFIYKTQLKLMKTCYNDSKLTHKQCQKHYITYSHQVDMMEMREIVRKELLFIYIKPMSSIYIGFLKHCLPTIGKYKIGHLFSLYSLLVFFFFN